ncbi:hypothetical protein BO79DRAFT_250978 [Aspergillus costaricaensis CBS 115574]|uniref:Uncharacterized protein n=1 Tax=Aspergillus costaricaensis CBS 115574 TaxID=1448317 RepID=A0ACD1ISI7_9EURO|nr:hypothetical protein BO79DRAFT_250978 [Aspergillus costaricaensis CBS 115574]RAK93288.1 hypothetical protein BO79DRAFT_250978 [Aspergillus costaricaensis CBS 115574]
MELRATRNSAPILQLFGPTIADYQTLVNDRLNLRWVQEPSKTSRRTIWMFFPPGQIGGFAALCGFLGVDISDCMEEASLVNTQPPTISVVDRLDVAVDLRGETMPQSAKRRMYRDSQHGTPC